MARRKKLTTTPLALPVPFRAAAPAFTTTEELIEVLLFLDELHDRTQPEDGAFYAGLLAEDLRQLEPAVPNLVEDVATAIAVGIGVHRVAAQRPALGTPDGEMPLLAAHVLAWAAMEQAIDQPERHGPWVTYATQLGYVIARRGDAVVRNASSELRAWYAACPAMTHSAYFDNRLVLDIGADQHGNAVARNYVPVRPAGIERAHDTLLFNTACDDFTERLHGTRVNGTTRLRNVFPFTWKALAG